VPRAAVIGEELRVQGYALAGALVCPAEDHDAAAAAWHSLPPDIAVAILTPRTAAWLGDELGQRPSVLTVVMRA
jgi:vacuolar-type H+-ATPase subunit F/Vma7